MTTDIIYRYKNQVYFNITNKCPCRCTFCIRNTEDAIGEASNLWFEHEPALEEIYKAIDEFDFSDCNEVVFCGYGEPTMALENLIAVSKYIRERYPFRIRLNTNGLSDLIHKRSTAEEICQAVDSISISLNMPDAASYNEVVRPAYGEKSFEYSHHRYCRIHSKLPRPPPVTGAAYIGTLQNRTCFKGETGWLRNIICPSLRGADFFYVIGNYSVMFL